jgi:mannose-6-phosphate isomerase
MSEARLVKIRPAVQHYEWGGTEVLPALLGIANPDRQPFAELWFGAHPKAPSTAETPQGSMPLDALIRQDPAGWLGQAVLSRFGAALPFLLKVLDARKMLSIQVHPTLEQAREGFERENALGIPVHAPHRNYRDRNHKPEIHAALSEFWMLHGFRPLSEIASWVQSTPEAASIMPDFAEQLRAAGADRPRRASLLRELYTHIMHLPQERVDELLDSLLDRLERAAPWPTETPEHWALRAAREFPLPGGRRDRGIFSIFLLNLVKLSPGQGTFQPAGVLHAYLQGTTVELMANSDNVLRGGLTPKHVDVEELLRIVRFEDGPCSVLEGESGPDGERVYRGPVEDFELSCLPLAGAAVVREARGPEILLALEGKASVSAGGAAVELHRGQAVFVGAGVRYELSAPDRAVIWRAKTGMAFQAAGVVS